MYVEWICEQVSYLLGQWAFLDILGHVGRLTILIAVIFYFMEADERRIEAENQRKAKHYQAWQVINAAQGKTGSGGRIDALQDLNRDRVSLAIIDISGANLTGIDIENANLRGANLSETDLPIANLSEADLTGANLSEADLTGTNLSGAILCGANLSGANLQGTNLSMANLTLTELSGADLSSLVKGDHLRFPQVGRRTDISTNLPNLPNLPPILIPFGETIKTRTEVPPLRYTTGESKGTNLSGAILWGANFSGANLSSVNLRGVYLRDTNLKDVKNWQNIQSIELANIYNVDNPPEGFIDWAKEHGAVSIRNYGEWKKLLQEKKKEK